MAVYPDAISELLERSEYSGGVVGDAAIGRAVNFDCGGFVEVFLDVSEHAGSVSAARFRSNGCGFMVAAAEVVCSELSGAKLVGLHGLEGIGDKLAEKFDTLPESKGGCFDAVIDALKGAFREHRNQIVAEFAGEKALVCTCFGISEETILKFIIAEQPTTVQEVSDFCRAGSGCGSCRMIIQEMLDTAERERIMTKT